jgi:hypothetical protein
MTDIVERLRTADIYDHADADKFCNEAADEIEKLRAKYGDLEKELGSLRVALKKISFNARRKDKTPEALLVVCDAIARAPLGEGP